MSEPTPEKLPPIWRRRSGGGGAHGVTERTEGSKSGRARPAAKAWGVLSGGSSTRAHISVQPADLLAELQ
jgi:hypothetical protein